MESTAGPEISLEMPRFDIGLRIVKELFVADEFAAALELSEKLRAAGTFDAETAVIQAICLDRLGHADAAALRLDELERVLAGAGAATELLRIARRFIGDGPRGSRGTTALKQQAMRRVPKLDPTTTSTRKP